MSIITAVKFITQADCCYCGLSAERSKSEETDEEIVRIIANLGN